MSDAWWGETAHLLGHRAIWAGLCGYIVTKWQLVTIGAGHHGHGKGKTLTKENGTVPLSDNGPSGLKGNLGVASIVMMVVAAAAPLTVMAANSPLIIAMGNGIAAPLDAAIATLIM